MKSGKLVNKSMNLLLTKRAKKIEADIVKKFKTFENFTRSSVLKLLAS